MAKYHELVKAYAGEIAFIKETMKEQRKLEAQAEAMGGDEDGPEGVPIKAAELFDKADDLQIAASSVFDMLSQDIEAEYNDVPFAKSRNAGIDGFWREAGLSPR